MLGGLLTKSSMVHISKTACTYLPLQMQARHLRAVRSLPLPWILPWTLKGGRCRARLQDLYRRGMGMELRFFSAQKPLPAAPALRMLVVDFDETLTLADTTPLIINAAAKAVLQGLEKSKGGSEQEKRRREAVVRDLVAKLNAEHKNLYGRLLPQEPWPSYNEDWIRSFISELTELERDLNTAAVATGLLAGLPTGGLFEAGKDVVFQSGALKVLRHALEKRVPVYVISVSWSTELLVSSLMRNKLPAHEQGQWGAGDTSGSIGVLANNLEYETGMSTGKIVRRYEGGQDKSGAFRKILGAARVHHEGSGAVSGLSVYVGDSPSDLLPMLEADLGIIVGSNPRLREIATFGGVTIRPLAAAPAVGQAGERGTLYETTCWEEIDAFLFGAPGGRGAS
eukprot:jgi/Botrbrau1/14997/Bobra.0018s0097.1